MNKKQITQINKQLKKHNHKDYFIDVKYTEKDVLKNFKVMQNVFRPEITSSIFLSKWLWFNNGLYRDKKVLDMGCGSGLQGITAGKYGAKNIIFTDISDAALDNTKHNVSKFKLSSISTIVKSNLFSNIDKSNKFDIIIFNHPFFDGQPINDKIVSYAMLGGKKLLSVFLKDAKSYLSNNGEIIFIYYDLAGKVNNPLIQGKKFNYKVTTLFYQNVSVGLQKGMVLICSLKK